MWRRLVEMMGLRPATPDSERVVKERQLAKLEADVKVTNSKITRIRAEAMIAQRRVER